MSDVLRYYIIRLSRVGKRDIPKRIGSRHDFTLMAFVSSTFVPKICGAILFRRYSYQGSICLNCWKPNKRTWSGITDGFSILSESLLRWTKRDFCLLVIFTSSSIFVLYILFFRFFSPYILVAISKQILWQLILTFNNSFLKNLHIYPIKV